MSRPKIVIHIKDKNLLQQLSDLPQLQQCEWIIPSSDWLETLQQADVDLVLLQSSAVINSEVQQLNVSNLLLQQEWLFFSDGAPDPALDQLIHKSAGYHFRPPIDDKLLADVLDDFLADYAQQQQQTALKARCATSSALDQFGLLVGSSRAMHKLYRTLRKVANSEAQVLIMGESGTGKELVANTLHLASNRNQGPFVAINCGALSPELVDSELFGHIKGAFTGAVKDHKGVFEQAEGGTLFLDEITEMPLPHQVKLLRVLENREYRPVGSQQLKTANIRIIAATNRDPQQAIAAELFREDLYFRLAQFPLLVPPLREREQDIIGLAQHFLAYRNVAENTQVAIADDALAKIAAHNWPGNVRELKYTVERAYILADEVVLPQHIQLAENISLAEAPLDASIDNIPAGIPLETLTRAAIEATLAENNGNRTATAAQLGISIKTLYNKLEKYQEDQNEST